MSPGAMSSNHHDGRRRLQPKDVQRLVIVVAASCSPRRRAFRGVALGAGAFVALNRTVNSNNEAAADRFETYLAQLRALPPGQPFTLQFTEEEISSYFRLRLAPRVGVTDGKVRLLDESSQLLVTGQASDLGSLPLRPIELKDTPGAPLRLTSAAIRVLQLKDENGKISSFGWVFVPTPLLQPLASNLNNLFSNVQLTGVAAPAPQTWTVSGAAR
jgi:hypothetical protein